MTTSEPPDTPVKSAASKLFDIRVLIGGLFSVYGVMLAVNGLFFVSPAELDKAAGLNINLWLGIGMLALGIFFLVWVRLSPLQHVAEPNPTGTRSDETEPPDQPRPPSTH